MKTHLKLEQVHLSVMEDFIWRKEYDGIWLSWVTGYPSDAGLVSFLKKAKAHLVRPKGKVTRKNPLRSFIFVFETVLPRERAEFESDG